MDIKNIRGFKWFRFELTENPITYELIMVTLDAFSKLSFDEKEKQTFYYLEQEWKPISWRDLREFLLLHL
jgi:hypothetical protein